MRMLTSLCVALLLAVGWSLKPFTWAAGCSPAPESSPGARFVLAVVSTGVIVGLRLYMKSIICICKAWLPKSKYERSWLKEIRRLQKHIEKLEKKLARLEEQAPEVEAKHEKQQKDLIDQINSQQDIALAAISVTSVNNFNFRQREHQHDLLKIELKRVAGSVDRHHEITRMIKAYLHNPDKEGNFHLRYTAFCLDMGFSEAPDSELLSKVLEAFRASSLAGNTYAPLSQSRTTSLPARQHRVEPTQLSAAPTALPSRGPPQSANGEGGSWHRQTTIPRGRQAASTSTGRPWKP